MSLGEFRMRTKMFLIASALENWIVKLSKLPGFIVALRRNVLRMISIR